jgi:zinc transporter ZupT
MKALIIYSLVALGTTLFGSAVPLLKAGWAEKHKWRLLAFSSGVLLAVAILHIFPEALAMNGKSASLAVLITFGALFLMENLTSVHAGDDFLHPRSLEMVPFTALIALTLHAGVDGMAMGVSLRQNLAFGSAISIGVILHKFVDGLTRTSLLHTAHYYKFKEISLSILLALATRWALFSPISARPISPHISIGLILAVSAGSFLYVAAADLLPRLHESHDRYNLVFFLIGLLVVGLFP